MTAGPPSSFILHPSSFILHTTSTTPGYVRAVQQNVAGTAFETYTLTHSYLGQLLQQSGSGASTETLAYGFDGRGRLTGDSENVSTRAGSCNVSGAYSWDLSNNLQGGLNGWTYNSNNQVTSAATMGGLGGASGIGYDAAGNLTTANGMAFSYDAWGHVSSIAGTPVGTVSYAYDFAGRRVSKTVGGVTTYFLYDGDMLVCEIDGATGTVTRSYNWGAAGLVSDREASGSRYYLFDAQNNAREIVDANGSVLTYGAFTAWGSPIGALSPDTPMGWKGRIGVYLGRETGLIYMRARYYAPNLGRFVSRDPLGFTSDTNVYAYCGGDPIDFVDALGLE